MLKIGSRRQAVRNMGSADMRAIRRIPEVLALRLLRINVGDNFSVYLIVYLRDERQ